MNKDLLVDGKTYISASRASKKYGYTQDHIGALARSQKISGKMMGRSWYVDPDSLLRHKELGRKRNRLSTPTSKKPKVNPFGTFASDSQRTFPIAAQEMPIVPKRILSAPRYMTPKPADIKKISQTKNKNFVRLSQRNVFFVVLSLVIVSSVIFDGREYLKWAEMRSVDQISTIHNSQTAVVVKSDSNFFAAIENIFLSFFHIFDSQNSGGLNDSEVAKEKSSEKNGVVVLPGGNHDDAVAQVKSAFSDDVTVSLDPSGDSGVVTPNFRSGADTENYTFVLVPVYPKK